MLGTSHRHAPKNSMSLTFLKSVRDWVIVGEENQQWHELKIIQYIYLPLI